MAAKKKKKATKKATNKGSKVVNGTYESLKKFIDDNKDELGENYGKLKDLLDQVKDKLENNKEIKKVVKFIKDHPIVSVASAALIGMVLAKLVGGRRK